MNFIWEFATDSEMNGKYGYGFATFQIGVEIVARLEDSIWHMDENTKPESTNLNPNIPSVTTGPPNTLESGGILEKRAQLVSQRVHSSSKSDDDDF